MEVGYHEPVLLSECIEGLSIKPDGVYVDVTFGGGGHSKAILEKLSPQGKLFAFDQDQEARNNAESISHEAFIFVAANFRHLKKYLRLYGATEINGLLGDLGVSSHQIDSAERGFSTRFEGPLDMRMDQNQETTAATIINEYSEKELQRILGAYGEVKNAKTLAQAIVAERINQPLRTTSDLRNILSRFAKKGQESKYYAQVFQALRIEVNQELKALEELIEQSTELLSKGGRLVLNVLSFAGRPPCEKLLCKREILRRSRKRLLR